MAAPLTKMREHIVKANILPAGLYGVEASHANKTTLRALRAAIANAIGPRSARASNDIVFNNTMCSGDLDPYTYVVTQRIMGLRRTIAKHPHMQSKIVQSIRLYSQQSNADCLPCGPVGLLIDSLHDVGATIDANLIIRKEGEAPIALTHMAWQHLKKAITDLCVNHRASIAQEERTHLHNVGEIGAQLTKKIVNGLGDKERKVYGHLSSGAAWSEAHLQDIGLSQGRCSHCGGAPEDITHVTWHCPAIHKHRQFKDLQHINPDVLPGYIKHGVPKAMSADIEATFWGDVLEPDHIQNHSPTCNAIGLQTCNRKKVIASCKNQEIIQVLSKYDLNNKQHNARQCFHNIKANRSEPHLPMPHRCHRPAPDDINVYTDGSWIHPLQQYLGLGGAGVWWPGRDPRVYQRLSQAEQELAHFQQYEGGLMLYTPIGGYTGSSTRTELAAAIIS